jgi:miniconductance mechanosensitive channel
VIYKENFTFLVRQLAPTPNGLPIELYIFTNETRGDIYEDIQTNIFDHLFAVIPEFKLKVFQNSNV